MCSPNSTKSNKKTALCYICNYGFALGLGEHIGSPLQLNIFIYRIHFFIFAKKKPTQPIAE